MPDDLKYSRNDLRKAMFHSPITLNIDKVELPIIKGRRPQKKIDKLILPLSPVQLGEFYFRFQERKWCPRSLKENNNFPRNRT